MFNLSLLRKKHRNPRKITGEQLAVLKKSVSEFSKMLPLRPIIYDPATFEVLGGNQRLEALLQLGYKSVPAEWVRSCDDFTEGEKRRFVIADNVGFGEWDDDILKEDFDLSDLGDWGFDVGLLESGIVDEEINKPMNLTQIPKPHEGRLFEKFIVPPVSVLDTRAGYWVERKRAWIGLGIKSEEGRGDSLVLQAAAQAPDYYNVKALLQENGMPFKNDDIIRWLNENGRHVQGTSVFDPVLCELMYKWFCPVKGTVLDPFAGGCVRGVVAGRLGYEYYGNDLRAEQISANIKSLNNVDMSNAVLPTWTVGDSCDIDTLLAGSYDMVFSCPPYADLEIYSEDENDLSNMDYDSFLKSYRIVIKKSISMLKDNRFACFVVTEIRGKKHFYRNFIQHTIAAFEDAGAFFYNDIVLLNQMGSLAMRVGRQFSANRKIGRCHQNVLIFYKGDVSMIRKHYTDIESELK